MENGMGNEGRNPGRPPLTTRLSVLGKIGAALFCAALLLTGGINLYESWTLDPDTAKQASDRIDGLWVYGAITALAVVGQVWMVLSFSNKVPHEQYIDHLETQNEQLQSDLYEQANKP